MKSLCLSAILSLIMAGASLAASVQIGPPVPGVAPGGMIFATPDSQKPGTKANAELRRAYGIIGLAVLFGGEKACSLNYDQSLMDAVIAKESPPNDKTFRKPVLKQIALVKKTARSWNAATVATTCKQIEDIARQSGLIK